jgi:methylmalonyl-CoA mutase N-terminal domain/subunit
VSEISFFFYTHGDFFEEVAKYRAGRRRWASIVRERYRAKDDRSCMFRVGCVCGGASLHAQEAQNNIVRVAYEAMASVLGGVQSMFTAAWDEPFALPTEETTTLALRTQQILAYETGVTRTVDPLGGSYYVEELTDQMEAKIVQIMEDLEADGGVVDAVSTGRLQTLIGDEASRRQRRLESGEDVVVGVNKYASGEGIPDVDGFELDEKGIETQIARLQEVRRERHDAGVRRTLHALRQGAESDTNLMPLLIDCARAHATEGEIVGALQDVFGSYTETPVF